MRSSQKAASTSSGVWRVSLAALLTRTATGPSFSAMSAMTCWYNPISRNIGAPVQRRRSAGCGDRVGERLAGVVLNVNEAHVRTLSGELGDELGSEPRSTAAYQHNLAPQARVGSERPVAANLGGAHSRGCPGTTTARPTAPAPSSS